MSTNADLPEAVTEAALADDSRPSRRRFFTLGASAAVGLAAAQTLEAQRPKSRGSSPFPNGQTSNAAADASAAWGDPVLRLVRRITMGMNPEEVALARRLGYAGYLDYQLRAAAIDDSAIETIIASRLPMTQMAAATLATQDGNEVANQLADATWYRAAFSKAQLRERMVEFWTDHFTISLNKVGYLKLVDDRDVIRPFAMRTFPELLRATSESGAMLVYLDQNRSRTPTPNQNYAREIMELHTLGVDGGYSQTDVAELSRILTGWTTTGPGMFAFNRNFHDRNAKTFLGRSFPAMLATATDVQLKSEGDAAIQMLVAHPSTAAYISLKMARWLLAYEPPQAVVDAMAATYLATGGDITAMIRTILSGKNLLAAPAKYKRPFHLAISAMRGMSASVVNIRAARQRADQMGMPVFMWEQPNGYPDRVDWWSGLVMSRWSYMQYLSTQTSATTTRVDSAPFRVPDTADGVVAQIAARMYGGELPPALRTQLLTYLRGGTYSDARVRETIALASSAQEYQWF
ncbi:DUF1800 domain-containing protein [Gemmatimonas groenlandica]|uniref:DUF1800 domain-containing protein n=1 Tax=Gemmatimonas groenlandica TaxID=2732249 RepID=A0A6M4INR1_9BACT|nr:DUF1800 domain-containing protein [Gemmatimonas groenlandica]QJR35665.1 DUF1800 domain-containing protein [Gemmatimonas groenlandica]